MINRTRFNEIDREQLAAQLVAVMDAHFLRPTTAEKQSILERASRQLLAFDESGHQVSDGLQPRRLPV